MQVMSPVAAKLEEIVMEWIVDVLGLPSGSGAGFVTGTTMANFSALAAARTALLKRAGWDVEEDGLFGAPPIHVVVSDEVAAQVVRVGDREPPPAGGADSVAGPGHFGGDWARPGR
jgi:hypothetical protein